MWHNIRGVLVALVVSVCMSLMHGCTTLNVENLTMTGSTVTVNMPKTVTITTDASVPAGALGL